MLTDCATNPASKCPDELRVSRFKSFPEAATFKAPWNKLSQQIPFRRWEWLSTWWKHFQQGRELCLLAVTDQNGTLRGIVPWYFDSSHGRCLRFLGDGKACSDYVSFLVDPEHASAVVDSVVRWLSHCDAADHPDRWDRIELEAVSTSDFVLPTFVQALQQHSFPISRRPGESTYPLRLPDSVEGYIASRSRTKRREMHRLRRELDSRRKTVRHIRDVELLGPDTWDVFVDLHQLRRHSLGEKGCFDIPIFGDFLREATAELMSAQAANLLIVEDGETPMSATLLFNNEQTTYVYQSGMDHGVTETSPGLVANFLGIWWTIQRGGRCFDFLRGDEAYKKSWHAQPIPTEDLRVSSRRAKGRIRHSVVTAGEAFKDLVRLGLSSSGLR